MAVTNNITRMLDAQKITYAAFETPTVKLTALEVCDHLQIPPGRCIQDNRPSP